MQLVGETLHAAAKPLVNDRPTWERQPRETDKAWQAFVTYRDMMNGRRSLQRVADELEHASLSTVSKWSLTWQWLQRVSDYERWLDLSRQQEMREEVVKMAQRHAQQAQLYIGVLSQPAMALMRKVQGDPSFFDRMLKSVERADGSLDVGMTFEMMDKLQKFAKTFPEIAALERVARGLPATIEEQRTTDAPREARKQLANEHILNDEESSRMAAELFRRINVHLPSTDDDEDEDDAEEAV
jgi:hypothetical protein